MLKNKIVSVGLAGMLTMSLGLAACGGQTTTTEQSSTEATTTEKTTDKATDAAEANKIIYWEGTTSDGQSVVYTEDDESSTATLAVIKSDLSDGKSWSGKVALQDNKVTITDDTTKETITLTVVDAADDFSSLKVNIDGYGEIDMKPITQAEFEKEVEAIATAAITEAVTEAADEFSKTTVAWSGTLADGQEVGYADDAESKEAAISIVKADGSDGKAWAGKVTVTDGKNTITDEETKETITFTVVSGGADSSSRKLNIDGYGEVELKPVTGSDVANEIGNFIEQMAKEAK